MTTPTPPPGPARRVGLGRSTGSTKHRPPPRIGGGVLRSSGPRLERQLSFDFLGHLLVWYAGSVSGPSSTTITPMPGVPYPMQPSGEVGRFEVDDQPSPPVDRSRYVAKNAYMAISTNNPNSRPVTRWLNHLTCPFLVITAVVMAFPQLIGSKDEPAYALAIAFLALAVVLGIAPYARESENRRSKEEELVRAATEFDVLPHGDVDDIVNDDNPYQPPRSS